MRNLSRISNYWNKVEAWRDWNRTLADAELIGLTVSESEKPVDGMGWRKIDKLMAALRARVEEAEKGALKA